MTSPAGTVVPVQPANDFVNLAIEQAQNNEQQQGSSDDQDQDSGDANSPPNFWLGLINTGPVTFDKPINTPVTSGGADVDVGGVVDNPDNSQ
jgi:hypothetical protein